MKKIVCFTVGVLIVMASFLTYAQSSVNSTLAPPHTSRTLIVKDKNQSGWRFSFTALSEQNLIEFTDSNEQYIPLNQWFPITDSFKYYFSFQSGADFDIIYAITAINDEHDPIRMGNPKCTFLLSGLKPMVGENYVTNFAKAKCVLERDSQGNLNLILDK